MPGIELGTPTVAAELVLPRFLGGSNYGDKKLNAGRFRRTVKIIASINSGQSSFAGKNIPFGRWRSLFQPNHALRNAAAASASTNNALSRNASAKWPCSSAYSARVIPHPGQFKPVSR